MRLGCLAAVLAPLLLAGCGSGAPAPSTPLPSVTARPAASAAPSALPVARAVSTTPSPGAGASPVAVVGTARAAQAFVLQSSAFSGGGTIPAEYTCDGSDTSPPMAWSGAPAGTVAYALIEQDTDVLPGPEAFTQWLLYNMPRSITQLAPAQPARPLLANGAQQGQNGTSTVGYLGPCPSPGDPPHHFRFELFAQDAYVTLETGAPIDDVRTALQGHVLGQTQLSATVQR